MSKLATFRIEEDLWQRFQDIAKEGKTSASALLIAYVQSVVNNGIDTRSIQHIDVVEEQDIDFSSFCIDDLREIIDQRIDERVTEIYKKLELLQERLGEAESLAVISTAGLEEEKIQQLEEENQELREQRDRLILEVEQLKQSPSSSLQQIKQVADQYLASLKMGKQSPDYKRTAKILTEFIGLLNIS